MTKFRFTLNFLVLVVFTLAASVIANAQTTRTWVSGTGNDADPCSYTAPCKTFAGAQSKTTMYGEISVMNSGAYGYITITKSLTIDGTGHLASILATGTIGVTINLTDASDTDKTVRLRGLSINGAPSSLLGPGTKGIRIVAANKVYVEDCVIDGFDTSGGTNGRGISDERIVAGGKLFVTNTTVRNNGSNGIIILPASGSAQLIAVLDRVVSEGNAASGVYAGSGSRVTIKDSNITGNSNAGVQADETAGSTEVTIERTVISHNLFGIYAGAGNSTVRMSEITVTHNTNGLEFAGGEIHTFGNCRIAGNTNDNGPPTSAILEQ